MKKKLLISLICFTSLLCSCSVLDDAEAFSETVDYVLSDETSGTLELSKLNNSNQEDIEMRTYKQYVLHPVDLSEYSLSTIMFSTIADGVYDFTLTLIVCSKLNHETVFYKSVPYEFQTDFTVKDEETDFDYLISNSSVDFILQFDKVLSSSEKEDEEYVDKYKIAIDSIMFFAIKEDE